MDENGTVPGTAAPGEPEVGAPETADTLTAEIRVLGEKLAAALRAATGTPEADVLKGDLQEGMEGLRREIDRALQKVPRARPESVTGAGGTSGTMQKLRGEVAGWLREANRALDRMATSLQGAAEAEATPAPDDDTPPTA